MDQYIGEIRMFGGNFAPLGWAFCGGQLLDISQYQALYTLIGTTYGGDGVNKFGLPDLKGRVPIHQGLSGGTNYVLGQTGGAEIVALNTNNIPTHTHAVTKSTGYVQASRSGNSTSPEGKFMAIDPTTKRFGNIKGNETTNTMYTSALNVTGGNLPHNNMMPSVALNFIIALEGIFPSRP